MVEAGPKAFVVGHPVAHSRSPLIHNYWLAEHGLNGSYERIDVAPDDFASFLASLVEQGFIGGNVTIPHKEMAFAAIGEQDEAAKAIGAINTIWAQDGRLLGSNTDAFGFSANLDDKAPQWRNGTRACVLGAGGAARAIVYALIQAGFEEIIVINRNLDRARYLSEAFGPKLRPLGWSAVDSALDGVDLLINTTSLGMGGTEFPVLPLGRLSAAAIVTDIVYTPLCTPLLSQAERAGLKTVDGLGMLLHQAVPGFEKWFGKRPVVTPALRDHVLADMEKSK